MDIYEYLRKDHQKVKHLFSQFEKTTDANYKLQIIDLLANELKLHTISEQETFYKYLERFENSKKLLNHAKREHQQIEDRLKEISQAKTVTPAFNKKVLQLRELVEHHINEEQGDMFNKCKKLLSKEDMYILKERMHDYKEKMLQQSS
jgi:hypothetical protein